MCGEEQLDSEQCFATSTGAPTWFQDEISPPLSMFWPRNSGFNSMKRFQ